MNESRGAVPPPTAFQGTLRKITETLAGELACPTQRTPDWSDFEWKIAKAVAAMHGVSPLLSKTLRWQGPAGWMTFLEEQRIHTATRHRRIDELLQHIDERGRATGIAAVALKGAALHAIGLYAVGERPMADIDLLVKPADAERMAELLKSLGYYESCAFWKERMFITPVVEHAVGDLGEHSNNNVTIELHERICERLPWRITDVTDLVFPTQAHPGVNAYPSTASLMIHLLLHAAGSMAYQALRLLHLHDLAQLSSRMTEADWDQVLAQRSGGRLWWAFPPLHLAARYFSSRIPSRVLAALADDCPYVLHLVSRRRTLYEVSYSYPCVTAFPGVEWAQSFREVLEYTVSRVRPSAEQIALREHSAKTDAWASQGQWGRLSQRRRIVRWVTSRPPRAVTMHAVSAALRYAP
jgi:Uncharacterised nucleotidyltransferase